MNFLMANLNLRDSNLFSSAVLCMLLRVVTLLTSVFCSLTLAAFLLSFLAFFYLAFCMRLFFSILSWTILEFSSPSSSACWALSSLINWLFFLCRVDLIILFWVILYKRSFSSKVNSYLLRFPCLLSRSWLIEADPNFVTGMFSSVWILARSTFSLLKEPWESTVMSLYSVTSPFWV